MNLVRAATTAALGLALLPVSIAAVAHADEGSDAEGPGHVLDRTIEDPAIDAASGLAASTLRAGLLFTHNDRADGARVFAVGPDGRTGAELRLRDAVQGDWADISPGPDHTLWVGDIGDPGWERDRVTVYSFAEPTELRDAWVDTTAYTFVYPDGARDAQAMMVDPSTGDLYLVSKARAGAAIYQASAPLSTRRPNELTEVATAPADVTGAAFAPDGQRFVLTTGSRGYLYTEIGAEPQEIAVPQLDRGSSVAIDCARVPAVDPETGDDVEVPDCTSAVLLSGTPGERAPVYRTVLPPTTGLPEVPTPGDSGGPHGDEPPPGYRVHHAFDLSTDEGWSYKQGKTNNLGLNSEENVSYGPEGQVLTAEREPGPSPRYTTADALATAPDMVLPNHFRVRSVWRSSTFQEGQWPAQWLRPFGPGEGEIDIIEGFGGHIDGPEPVVHRSTLIATPYGPTQRNVGHEIDFSRIGLDPVEGIEQFVTYDFEKSPGRMRLWMNGVLMLTHTREGFDAVAGRGAWDRMFEVPTQRWYYRNTHQIGDDPDGHPYGEAGTVQPTFTRATTVLKELTFYVPATGSGTRP